MACNEATGVTLSIASDSDFYADIVDFDGPNMSRNAIDCTTLASTSMTYKPSTLVDYGELNVTLNFDPNVLPPISSVAEEVTLTFPTDNSVGASAGDSTWTFTGFMTNFSPSGSVGDKMTATATIKITGIIAVA